VLSFTCPSCIALALNEEEGVVVFCVVVPCAVEVVSWGIVVVVAVVELPPPPPQPTRNIEKDTESMLCFKYFGVYIVFLKIFKFL
jgi:hypothetical protein